MIKPMTKELDQRAVNVLEGNLLQVMNHAGLAMMISIGHRTGLFDAMARMPAATSHDIADSARLNERYVREWLGAMVTGGIVMYEPTGATYTLPAEHAARMTRAAFPMNMASAMQWMAILGSVEDDVVRCFREGGGVPYQRYTRFHEAMAEESNQTTIGGLTRHVLPAMPGMEHMLDSGADVLDVGCGRGNAMLHMAGMFPNSRFNGYDFSVEAISHARDMARKAGLQNARFEVVDATTMRELEQYDLVTAFDAIHDQMHPDKVLQNIHAALRPNGVFMMQDIHASSHVEKNIGGAMAPFLYTISTMHCMTVSLANGGCGLGACWGEEMAMKMLAKAGFAKVDVRRLEHDILNNYYFCRKK